MKSLHLESDSLYINPLDMAEQILIERDWVFDRPADEELITEVPGVWCNYRIWFNWQEDLRAVMFSCALDTKLPEAMHHKIYPLLAAANEKLWLGHFDLCSNDGIITFRHALLMAEGQSLSSGQLDELLDIALQECERFYPAFQSVVWANRPAKEAMSMAIFETVGEA